MDITQANNDVVLAANSCNSCYACSHVGLAVKQTDNLEPLKRWSGDKRPLVQPETIFCKTKTTDNNAGSCQLPLSRRIFDSQTLRHQPEWISWSLVVHDHSKRGLLLGPVPRFFDKPRRYFSTVSGSVQREEQLIKSCEF